MDVLGCPGRSQGVPARRRSVVHMTQADWARGIAHNLLAVHLPRRWAHTRGVAAQASRLAAVLGDDADLVEAAAWLHDVGYAPDLVVSGFHPLDGARYLRDVEGADDVLSRLVAHHSCAEVEATERGLHRTLRAEFEPPRFDLIGALTFCDMTTDPDGAPISVSHRLAEIMARYGDEHVVSRSIRRSAPMLREATETVAQRLTAYAQRRIAVVDSAEVGLW